MTREQAAQRRNRRRLILGFLLGLLVAGWVGFTLYVNDCYRADRAALEAMASTNSVTVEELEGGEVIFRPQRPKAGLIFYPGGKVEPAAYAPLMKACGEEGILCVLVEMPCNLAVLNVNGAAGIPSQFPEIENWYIGGHSLGGAMAASYGAKHSGELEGLVLLAAYSTADLTGTDLAVLSVYGTEDKVMDREKYEKYRANLPAGTVEVVLEGGCHGGFGSYGPQEGDGTPTLSGEEQIARTAQEIGAFIGEND